MFFRHIPDADKKDLSKDTTGVIIDERVIQSAIDYIEAQRKGSFGSFLLARESDEKNSKPLYVSEEECQAMKSLGGYGKIRKISQEKGYPVEVGDGIVKLTLTSGSAVIRVNIPSNGIK
jgi:hypothetical protein